MPRHRKNQSEEIEPEFAAELASEAASSPGLGYSTDPGDNIWIGDDGRLDPSDWIDDHLGPTHPLEDILEAIIRAHPSSSLGTVEVRLDRALHMLTGHRLRRGPKPMRWKMLLKIAEAWWVEHCANSAEPNLTAIIRRCVPDMSTLSHDQERGQIDAWRSAFVANKERLLKFVSGADTPEQISRTNMVQDIKDRLRGLGVPSAGM